MKRVILLHGNGDSSGSDNWQPYVKQELEKLGVTCLSPDLPDNVVARMSHWFPYFEETLSIGKDDIVVGHSSGALAIMKYAENHEVGGSVLVGTYYTDLGYQDEKDSGYFDTPWNWEAVKKNQPWTAIFASEDDPYIPLDQAQYVSANTNAEMIVIPGEGHFNLERSDEYKQFPKLVEILEERKLV